MAAALEDQDVDSEPDPYTGTPALLLFKPDTQSGAREAPDHRDEWDRRSGSTNLAPHK